jgi:DNA-binding NarL/FixJ family response regulator
VSPNQVQACILIADPQQLFRAGLRELLEAEPSWRVVGEAADGREAVHLTHELHPDLLLLELALSSPAGLQVVQQVAASAPSTRTLVVTGVADKEQVIAAVELGASGVLSKNASAEMLVRAVHGVLQGESWVDRASVSLLLRDLRAASRPGDPHWPRPPSASLTPREVEIIHEVLEGASNKLIAQGFGLCEQTVKNHLSNIYTKLGVSSRLELALYALHHGLLDVR